LFTIVVPSLLAGGLILGSSFGRADVTVTRDGQTIVIPTPPTPPTPPTDPWGAPSQRHQHQHQHHMSVSIHDGKVQIDGVRETVNDALKQARSMIESNPSIPPDVRARVLSRLDRVNGIVDRRISKLKTTDIDQLGEELGRMGEEIGNAMDGLGEDLSKLGDKIGKDVAKQIQKSFKHMAPHAVQTDDSNDSADDNKGNSDSDSDSDSDTDSDNDSATAVPTATAMDPDDDAAKQAIVKLGNLSLDSHQRAVIAQLRTDTERRVSAAKQEIDRLSDTLRVALDNPASSEAEVGRYVDQISAQEATIRKARINAWMSARRVLSDDQRAQVSGAAAAAKKAP
jgi:hypothetical protein